MNKREITYLTHVAMLTIVVQAGRSESILKSARELGAVSGAYGYRVNAIGARERLGLVRVAVEAEREVINIFVASNQTDVVVDHLYRVGRLDIPGSGYIYVTPLEKLATYVPESMRQQLAENKQLQDLL